MSLPLERLKPIGFWSYARQDDEMSDGRLSRLRYQLASELQLIYGRQTIKIFQDVAAIPPGAEWEKAIEDAIGQSTFFIPILTPAFIESEWCCREVSRFLEREAAINAAHPELGRRRRIFPIRYIDFRRADPFDPNVLAALGKFQGVDFQALRREDDQSPQVRDLLTRLAEELADLLAVKVRPAPTADELAAEQRRMQALEDERRNLDLRNREEEQRRREEAAALAAQKAEAMRVAKEAQHLADRQAAAERAADVVRRAAEAEAERIKLEAERTAEAERRRDAGEKRAAELAVRKELAKRQWAFIRRPVLVIGALVAVAMIIAFAILGRAPPSPALPPNSDAAPSSIEPGAPNAEVVSASPVPGSELSGRWAPASRVARGCKEGDPHLLTVAIEGDRIRLNSAPAAPLPPPNASGWRSMTDGAYWRVSANKLYITSTEPNTGAESSVVAEYVKCP